MFGKGFERMLFNLFFIGVVVNAVVGWALIEGVIWLFSHISFSWGG